MKGRKWLIFLAILAVIAIGGWFWWHSFSSTEEKKKITKRVVPEVSVANVNISDIDAERIKLVSKVMIKNPLPVNINTNKLDYEIFIDSIRVIQESYKKPISIRSSDSTTIELPMELLAEPMARVLKYFDQKKIDSADYKIKASFLVDVPVAGERNFTMNMSKRMPALRIPKVEVKDIDLNILKLKKEGVNMVVQVKNPNLFPLKLKDGTFSFKIDDDLEMDGALEKIINIPAHGSQNVSMHANLKEGKVLKVGWNLLTKKDETHFSFAFNCKLLSDNGMLNNSKIANTVKGSLNELLKAVKKVK